MRTPRFMMPPESPFNMHDMPQPNDLALGQTDITNQAMSNLFPDADAQTAQVNVAAVHDLARSIVQEMSANGMLHTTPEGVQALQAQAIIELTRDVFLGESKDHMVDADSTKQVRREKIHELVARVFAIADASGRLNANYKRSNEDNQ